MSEKRVRHISRVLKKENEMRQMWIFIISMLISIVSIDAVVHANVTVYMNANVGVEYQLEQEGFFLEMLNDPNMPNDPNFFIDFDNSPAGPTSAGPISGNEWQQFGVIFSQPEGFGLELKTADINRTPHSSPHGLWPKPRR